MTPLVDNDYPILVYPKLAKAVGLNESIVLNQVHYWTEQNKMAHRNYKDGYYWCYNSYPSWQAQQFPFWSVDTVKRTFLALEKIGLLVSGVYNKAGFDKKKWYRINYEALDERLNEADCNVNEGNLHSPITDNTLENNGTMDIMVSSSKDEETTPMAPPISVPKVHKSEEDISGFIDWYFDYYRDIKDVAHPLLKSAQLIKVHDTLKAFCDENEIDSEKLKAMAAAFFDLSTSDHNINHFATAGILENRYYEAVY